MKNFVRFNHFLLSQKPPFKTLISCYGFLLLFQNFSSVFKEIKTISSTNNYNILLIMEEENVPLT